MLANMGNSHMNSIKGGAFVPACLLVRFLGVISIEDPYNP